MHPYGHFRVIYNSQDLEEANVPINVRVDKKKQGYTYSMEYYSVVKRGNLTLRDSMDRPGEYYAKGNRPVRERQYHVWNLMNKIN